MKKIFIALLLASSFLSGCAVHSPMLGFNRTVLTNQTKANYASHTNEVFVTKAKLPESIPYEHICKVDVGKVWWGGHGWVMKDMANRARKVGGNAVVEVNVWKQPSGWAWAAPHGNGQIIKVADPQALKDAGIEGWEY